jgi:hypothetical protein
LCCGGTCVTCPQGQVCCGSACVNTTSNVMNCGGCGFVCGPYPNATAGCFNSSCAIAACNQGWADCNKVVADGCETNIFTDPKNCGGCGNVCPNGRCQNGACV